MGKYRLILQEKKINKERVKVDVFSSTHTYQNKKSSKLYFILFPIILCSCSFNFMFLVPTKLNDKNSSASIRHFESKDTLLVTYNAQKDPSFLNISDTSYVMDFSIQNGFIPNQKDSLNYWYIKPNHPNDTILFFLHGNAGHLPSQYQEMLPFVKEGYSTFIIDYSGFGWSSGKAKRKIVLTDALTAFDYMMADTLIKKRATIVYGQSLGGHLAVVMAEQRQDKIDKLIIEGAFSSHKKIASDVAGFLGNWFVKEGYAAYESIARMNIPTTIIHSTEDEVIPFYHGWALYELCSAPKTFLKIDKCHICAPFYYADKILAEIRK